MITRKDVTVSVVIPCYNGGAHLREAINSALMQSHPVLEVLVIDDGSTDGSAAIAGSFGPPVRVIRQENSGESVARNRGIDEALGEWVAFLDADDVWHFDKLRHQVAAIDLEGGGVICVYTDYYLFTNHEDRREVHAKELDRRDDYRIAMILDWCIHCSSAMVARSAAREVYFPVDIRHGEDRIFFWKLRQIGPFAHVPLCLSGYRTSDLQQTKEVHYLLNSSRSYLALLKKYEFREEEEDLIREKILSDLVLGHRRAYYARDTRMTHAYRSMYSELVGSTDHLPEEMSKPIYPRLVFRIKDLLDAAMRGGRGNNVDHYDQEFYENVEKRTIDSARRCVPAMLETLGPRSIVDVGCGQGHWLRAFSELGVEDILGVEGSHLFQVDVAIPREKLLCKNLAEPFRLDRTFDLALCLEVAEHLPPETSESFIDSLTSLSPLIVFSAAIPGQGGVEHVNERWPWYWQELFARRNYVRFDPFRKRFWGDPQIATYYQQNFFVYARGDISREVLHRLSDFQSPSLTLISERVLRNMAEGNGGR